MTGGGGAEALQASFKQMASEVAGGISQVRVAVAVAVAVTMTMTLSAVQDDLQRILELRGARQVAAVAVAAGVWATD